MGFHHRLVLREQQNGSLWSLLLTFPASKEFRTDTVQLYYNTLHKMAQMCCETVFQHDCKATWSGWVSCFDSTNLFLALLPELARGLSIVDWSAVS